MASSSSSLDSPLGDDPLERALARVTELESALDASEARSQVAQQELQYFMYAANHDLQEPLRAIATYAQLVERLHPDDEQAKEFVGIIKAAVARMKQLIETLLLYSRINQSPILSAVNLNATLQATLYKLSSAIKQSGAVVRFSEPAVIRAFETQVGQLFEQILTNSIQYRGPQPPHIEITIDDGELNGDDVQLISIKDNGVGIEEQYFSQVLQPFKRLHGKDYPGNGLGLAICDKIMRAHKGKLWIESDGKSWTTVKLAFPL